MTLNQITELFVPDWLAPTLPEPVDDTVSIFYKNGAVTHAEILVCAARRFTDGGPPDLSPENVKRLARMTTGGFYGSVSLLHNSRRLIDIQVRKSVLPVLTMKSQS